MTTPAPQRADALGLRAADFAVLRVVPTRWSDEDVYGHVNNAVHYLVFDTAVNGWLIDNGFLDIERSTTINLVVETGCRYGARTVGCAWGLRGRDELRAAGAEHLVEDPSALPPLLS